MPGLSVVHGADRNRYYVRSVAPFFSLPIYRYAMNCPAGQKRYRKLHAAILEQFQPNLVDLPYPNIGAPISSNRYRLKQFVYDYLDRYPDLRERVVRLVTSHDGDPRGVATAIRSQLPAREGYTRSREAVAAVTGGGDTCSGARLEYLYPITSLARDVAADEGACDEATLSPAGSGAETDA